MTAESFFESGICRSRAHCATCQGTGDAARGFRLSLSVVGITGLPGDGSPPQCPHGQKPQPLTIGGVVHGAVGLVKAATGIDKAPDDIVRSRLAICYTCEHWQDFAGGRCGLCGCFTLAKVRLRAERCPLDPPRWDAVREDHGK